MEYFTFTNVKEVKKNNAENNVFAFVGFLSKHSGNNVSFLIYNALLFPAFLLDVNLFTKFGGSDIRFEWSTICSLIYAFPLL